MGKKTGKNAVLLIISLSAIAFNTLILRFPNEIISAAKKGLWLWADNVLPSLLPFAIGINILSALGVISFIGALLEPVMRPLFRVPGCGGFALITGMTSGYPMGARTAALLCEDGKLNRDEAQRLMSFANNSGPLFILGALGANMLNNIRLGYFILAVHYLSAIINGILFRRFGEKGGPYRARGAENLFRRALREMAKTRGRRPAGFGRVLGESIESAVAAMLQIGGFIIFFCVLVSMLEVSGALGAGRGLAGGALAGALEITNGANMIASEPFSPAQIILLCGVVSFGGLSVHAQSVSFLSKTGVRPWLYILGKLSQGVIAMITGWIFYPFFDMAFDFSGGYGQTAAAQAFAARGGTALSRFTFSSLMFFAALAALVLVPLAFRLIRNITRRRSARSCR